MGTRYRHQARVKQVGADCVGLVGGVALACGVLGSQEWMADPAMHQYARSPSDDFLRRSCDRYLNRIPVANAREGDVLIFSIHGEWRHLALVSSAPRFIIHAYALLAARRVVEQSLPVAHATVVAAYSFRGLTA